jgi:pimeloyl-ACP methyl ester carboxylesterase
LFSVAIVAAIEAPSALSVCAQSTISIPAADGGSVIADLYGTGDRGVVLAPGGRFDRASWGDQAQELARGGFRVIAIDFRAAVDARAGRETPCLYDEVCLAKDVTAAVRYLRERGVRSVAIVGASLGGGAAAQAAVEAPPGAIDRLVLLAHMPIARPEKIQGRKLFVVSRGDLRAGETCAFPRSERSTRRRHLRRSSWCSAARRMRSSFFGRTRARGSCKRSCSSSTRPNAAQRLASQADT